MAEKLGPDDIARLKTRYEAGEKVEEIGKDVGVSKPTVISYAKRYGWTHGSRKKEIVERVESREREVVIAERVERSVQETEKFLQDVERIRALTLSFNGRIMKSRNAATGDFDIDREEADLVFQVLKCCKISMETLVAGYYGKRKALKMDDKTSDDIQVLPWED